MKNLHLIVLFCCLSLLLATVPAVAKSCNSCHKKVAAKGRSGRFVHQPFMKEKCEQCHIAGKSVAKTVKKSPLAIEKAQVAKIRWFQTVSGRQQEHWLRLPASKLSGPLYVKATDGRMRSPVRQVVLPKSGLAQKSDDHQPPKQSNLLVSDVRRGISTTATLQWQTDEFSDSIVYYGVDNLRSVKTDKQLLRQHTQVLLGLDADKTYQYQIVSRDLFGNETKSPVSTFTTDKSFWDQSANYRADSSLASDIELNWQLYRVKDDFLVEVKADRPVSVSFGMENSVVARNTKEREVDTAGQFSHPILKSSLDTNVKVCKDCHTGVREEYSHPIKVRARKGMVIPPEYTLLPDGTMSCMSCHDNHASNHEYRLRKSNKADLCRGCHSEY